MEQGEIVAHEEFGGTAWLTLPGQDPNLVRELIDGFTNHMGPINLIERLWIRDIAVLTARIEFLRHAQWAAIAWFTECAAKEISGEHGGSGAELDAATVRELLLQQQSGESAARDPRLHRLLGKAASDNLEVLTTLLEAETNVLAERNRLIITFDSERKNQVEEAIKLLQDTGMLANRVLAMPPIAEGGAGDAAAA